MTSSRPPIFCLEDAARERLPALLTRALHDPMHGVAADIEKLASSGQDGDVLDAVCATTRTTTRTTTATTSGSGRGVAFFSGDPLGHAPRPVSARAFLGQRADSGEEEVLYVSQQPLDGRLGAAAAAAARPPRELSFLPPLPTGGGSAAPAAAFRPHLWLSAPGGPATLSSCHYDDEDNLLCVLGRAAPPDAKQQEQRQQQQEGDKNPTAPSAPPPLLPPPPRPLGTGAKLVVVWPPECGPALLPRPPAGEWANHSALTAEDLLGSGLFASLAPKEGRRENAAAAAAVAADGDALSPSSLFRVHAVHLARRFLVRPGQALFIPAGWWHAVLSEPGCAAVNYWWRPRGGGGGGGGGGDAATPYALRRALDAEAMVIANAATTGIAHEYYGLFQAWVEKEEEAASPAKKQRRLKEEDEDDCGGEDEGRRAATTAAAAADLIRAPLAAGPSSPPEPPQPAFASSSGRGAPLPPTPCLAPGAHWADFARPRAFGALCLSLVHREAARLGLALDLSVMLDCLCTALAHSSPPAALEKMFSRPIALPPPGQWAPPPPPPPPRADSSLAADHHQIARFLDAACADPLAAFALTKILDQGTEGARVGARIWEAAGQRFRERRWLRRRYRGLGGSSGGGGGGGAGADDNEDEDEERRLERREMQRLFEALMAQRQVMLRLAARAAAAGAGAV